jgi:hypothetical protein
MKTPIVVHNAFKIPKVFIHMFGMDNAIYLMIANEYSLKTNKKGVFKIHTSDVSNEYGITKFKQKSAREYFQSNEILVVKDGETPKDGFDYSFNQEKVNDVNRIANMVDENNLQRFRKRVKKNIIVNSLDLDKICAIVEKL